MTPLRRYRRVRYLVVLALFPALACRDTEPLPSHYRDLGTDETVLLPTASAWCDPAVAKGQADWHPFRKLETKTKSTGKAADTGDKPEDGSEIEGEVRDLLDEYNGKVPDGSVDGLLEFFEEEQHDALRPLLEVSTQLAAKLSELRKQLEAKLPDAGDRIAAACDSLADNSGVGIKVQKLNVVSETEVSGEASSGSRRFPVRFELIDDAWYVKVPLGDGPAFVTKAALDQALAAYERWLGELGSAQTPGESVLQEIEAAAKAAAKADDEEAGSPGGDAVNG